MCVWKVGWFEGWKVGGLENFTPDATASGTGKVVSMMSSKKRG